MCVLCVYVLQSFVFYNWFMAFVERLGKPHFNWFLHKNLIKLPEKAEARVKCVLHATTEINKIRQNKIGKYKKNNHCH